MLGMCMGRMWKRICRSPMYYPMTCLSCASIRRYTLFWWHFSDIRDNLYGLITQSQYLPCSFHVPIPGAPCTIFISRGFDNLQTSDSDLIFKSLTIKWGLVKTYPFAKNIVYDCIVRVPVDIFNADIQIIQGGVRSKGWLLNKPSLAWRSTTIS